MDSSQMRNFRFLLPDETFLLISGEAVNVYGGIAHVFDEDGQICGLVTDFLYMIED